MLRAALALSVAIGLAGCAGAGAADVARDGSGRPTEAGTVRADRLRSGDCFDDQGDNSPGSFPVVPCGAEHANQAFLRFDVPGRAYPGQGTLTDIATARCTGQAFTDFVGRPQRDSSLSVFEVLPSKDTWENDQDRTVICALYRTDRGPLVGSAQDSDR